MSKTRGGECACARTGNVKQEVVSGEVMNRERANEFAVDMGGADWAAQIEYFCLFSLESLLKTVIFDKKLIIIKCYDQPNHPRPLPISDKPISRNQPVKPA